MIDRAVVRADNIVKIHSDNLKADHNESHRLNESGLSIGGVGYAKPFTESIGVQKALRGIVTE